MKHIKLIFFCIHFSLYIGADFFLDQIHQDEMQCHSIVKEKPLVIIIPSYNNQRWCEKNLMSVFEQKYSNYRVIYIDDASADRTSEKVISGIHKYNAWHRTTLIINTERMGAMANYYKAIHSCNDDEIVLMLDGDDFFAHDNVCSYINQVYQDENIWVTWGQFIEYPSGKKGFCADFPSEVVRDNRYRKNGMPVSHLRTFYAWLFKLVDKKDFMYKDIFYPMTWDKAIMAPLIEMAGGRYKFIDDILYIYNFANPISDCRVNGALQVEIRDYLYDQEPYKPLVDKIVTGKCMSLTPD